MLEEDGSVGMGCCVRLKFFLWIVRSVWIMLLVCVSLMCCRFWGVCSLCSVFLRFCLGVSSLVVIDMFWMWLSVMLFGLKMSRFVCMCLFGFGCRFVTMDL